MKLERCVGVAGFLSAWVAQGVAGASGSRGSARRDRRRDAAAFPGARPHGHDEPARQREARGRLRRAGARARRHPCADVRVEAHRPNVVARLTGNGRKRPLLFMAHTDTVNVDPAKWQHPPFSAARDGGHIYGRGTVDDKDSVTAALMTMLLLKRNLVPLDRDVIFLAEAGEEGNTEVYCSCPTSRRRGAAAARSAQRGKGRHGIDLRRRRARRRLERAAAESARLRAQPRAAQRAHRLDR